MCECAAMRLRPRSSLLSAIVVIGYMELVEVSEKREGVRTTAMARYDG
jgi:hypothetical protein